jgi:hypothetical protein
MALKSHGSFDPREVDAIVAKLDPRQELVHRLAIRWLCRRCCADKEFGTRTGQLTAKVHGNFAEIRTEALRLAAELARGSDTDR